MQVHSHIRIESGGSLSRSQCHATAEKARQQVRLPYRSWLPRKPTTRIGLDSNLDSNHVRTAPHR
jgi:hypothetical protein